MGEAGMDSPFLEMLGIGYIFWVYSSPDETFPLICSFTGELAAVE
jgi:hypothetical protein